MSTSRVKIDQDFFSSLPQDIRQSIYEYLTLSEIVKVSMLSTVNKKNVETTKLHHFFPSPTELMHQIEQIGLSLGSDICNEYVFSKKNSQIPYLYRLFKFCRFVETKRAIASTEPDNQILLYKTLISNDSSNIDPHLIFAACQEYQEIFSWIVVSLVLLSTGEKTNQNLLEHKTHYVNYAACDLRQKQHLANYRGCFRGKALLFNLKDANLEGEDLCTLNFSKSDFTQANLNKTKMNSLTKFSDANLYRASMIEAVVDGSFSGANLNRANLYRAKMEKPNFSGANLSNANLSYAKSNDYYTCVLNFDNANLTHIKSSQGRFFAADLTDADLSHAIFHYTVSFSKAFLVRTKLKNSSFGEVKLNETTFFEKKDFVSPTTLKTAINYWRNELQNHLHRESFGLAIAENIELFITKLLKGKKINDQDAFNLYAEAFVNELFESTLVKNTFYKITNKIRLFKLTDVSQKTFQIGRFILPADGERIDLVFLSPARINLWHNLKYLNYALDVSNEKNHVNNFC